MSYSRVADQETLRVTGTSAPAGHVPRHPRRIRGQGRRGELWATVLVFVLPYALLFLVFRIGPAVAGFVLSFANYSIAGEVRLVGLENFQRLLDDPLFWTALRVTLVYTLLSVPMVVIAGLAMALLCNRSVRGIRVYRFFFFLPVVTSFVLAGVVWRWLLGEDGVLNWILSVASIDPVPWLQSPGLVLPSLSVMTMWARFGYDMLILLAGLLAIPRDYYEAAQVDGASSWRQLWNITLPLLKPALFFVVIIELIHSFQVFDIIYVMTGGGPMNSSYNLVLMLYDHGFNYFEFGYASAIGVVLFIATLGISLIQRRLLGKRNT